MLILLKKYKQKTAITKVLHETWTQRLIEDINWYSFVINYQTTENSFPPIYFP